jgi:hypothetical protein
MSDLILKEQGVYFDKYNITSRVNGMASDYSAEPKDNTVLQSDTRTRKGGLKTGMFSFEGFTNPDTTDEGLFDAINVANKPITITAEGESIGDTCFSMQALATSFSPNNATIGELIGFSLEAEVSTDPLVRGVLALNSKDTPITANGNGTAQQFSGGIASGKKLYAFLHILELTGGGSIDFVIESDDNSGFTSGTDRITFTSASAATSEALSLAGSQTDDYYRVKYTKSGTVSCKAIVAFGII